MFPETLEILPPSLNIRCAKQNTPVWLKMILHGIQREKHGMYVIFIFFSMLIPQNIQLTGL